MSLRTSARILLRPTPFSRCTIRGHGLQTRHTATAPAPQSMLQKLWVSPVGPKTVHFWAPVMKWAVVLVGVSDFARPASSLSLTQNLALMATGAIWTRWCLIIKPRNVLLAAVNFFLGCVGFTQVMRVLVYRRGLEKEQKREVPLAVKVES